VDYVTEHSRRAATTLDAEGAAARAYASSWSLHPEEIVSLAVPEFVGSSVGTAEWTTGTYWGRNPFKLNHEYLGLVMLLLVALAWSGGRSAGIRWFMSGLGAVTLLFTLGSHTPVWRIFYELIPGISLFRAPSMAIFLAAFAGATLAGYGVDRGAALLEEGREGLLLRILGGIGGVLALGWLLTVTGALQPLWTGVLYGDIPGQKAEALARALPHIASGFGIALILTAVTAALWWAVGRRYLPPLLLVPALLVLIAIDQGRVNGAFIEVMDYRAFAAPDQNVRFLMEQQGGEDPFRVLSLRQGGEDVRPGMHGLELAGGHHPNDIGRYRDLIGREGSENLARFNPNLLGILNVRYILWPDADYGPLEAGMEPVSRVQLADGRVVSSLYAIGTLPRARVVGEAVVVSEDQAVATILDPERYDPTRQVVLTEAPPSSPGGPEVTGQARWIERGYHRLELDVEASGPALLVIADNWMPGWRATVDGAETPVLRADHTLRALAVPAGSHRVEVWYDPPILRAGLRISLVSLLVLTLALLYEPVSARLLRRRVGDGRGSDGGPDPGEGSPPSEPDAA